MLGTLPPYRVIQYSKHSVAKLHAQTNIIRTYEVRMTIQLAKLSKMLE